MDRRHFLAASSLAAATPWLASAASAPAAPAHAPGLFTRVNFAHDGLGYTPREYATRLHELAMAGDLAADNYSNGGLVAEIEQAMAKKLGKPAAMFLPTGTLANHVALRQLAGPGRRVLVQAESHVYNDTGDGASTLSGLNLVPLAPGRATVGLDEIQAWLQRSTTGRVAMQVGAISIESPVRRRDHECVDPAELDRVCAFARERGIRLHLDGARLFNLPLHTGRSLHEITAPFDTVMVSLWKHFNATSGAILAGEADFIEGLYHVRRMFGGSLPQAWADVALVPGHIDSYEAEYARAWQVADELIGRLTASGRFVVRKVERGSSRFFLSAPGQDLVAMAERAAQAGIVLPGGPPGATEWPMQVNPTLLRRPVAGIAAALLG